MSYNFEVGKVYTFNTNAPGILGTTIKNAKLKSVLDYDIARVYDNIDLKFRQVFPALPSGTPDTPESSVYYLFQTESGEKIVYADIWINESTITAIDHISFQVTVTNASMSDITRVRDAMNALGYTNYEIKQL